MIEGSLVVDQLSALEASGVELILWQTYLDYFHLTNGVVVGIVGDMLDIIEAKQKANEVISL